MSTERIDALLGSRITGTFFLGNELKELTNESDLPVILRQVNKICEEYSERHKKFFGPEFRFERIVDDAGPNTVRLYIEMPRVRDTAEVIVGHIDLATYEADNQIFVTPSTGGTPRYRKGFYEAITLEGLIGLLRPSTIKLDDVQIEALANYLEGYEKLAKKYRDSLLFDLDITETQLSITARRNYFVFCEYAMKLQ